MREREREYERERERDSRCDVYLQIRMFRFVTQRLKMMSVKTSKIIRQKIQNKYSVVAAVAAEHKLEMCFAQEAKINLELKMKKNGSTENIETSRRRKKFNISLV